MYGIARKFNTTVEELKRLNNLTGNIITVGQQLIVNSNMDNDFDTYVVKAGDTLYQIARDYNTSVDEIKRLNNLSSNLLSIGQVLKIPSQAIGNEQVIYTVKAGDNLYQIARTYNTTVEKIRNLNNLVSDLLSIGQKLLIPV